MRIYCPSEVNHSLHFKIKRKQTNKDLLEGGVAKGVQEVAAAPGDKLW